MLWHRKYVTIGEIMETEGSTGQIPGETDSCQKTKQYQEAGSESWSCYSRVNVI